MEKFPLLVAFSTTLLAGCSHWEAATLDPGEGEPTVLFLGDPQLHNMHGAVLMSITLNASRVARVAMRPPELNLLSKYMFMDLVEQARASNSGDLPLAIILGDVGDIACSSEIETFSQTAAGAFGSETGWLMAHGNHDTYMQGTINTYAENSSWAMPEILKSTSLPVDVSFWPQSADMASGAISWKKACYPSEPMNKISWLAKYMEMLAQQGVDFMSTGSTTSDGIRYETFEAIAPSSGPLSGRDYVLKGMWVKPENQPLESYRSFSVQAVNVGATHRLIMIDTSTCPYSPAGIGYPVLNAGTRGCIGEAQLDVIRDMATKHTDRTLVLAGHFPLGSVTSRDEKELLKIMESRLPVTYISAHSHNTLRVRDFGPGLEYNIGSTTDWPMEAHIFNFSNDRSVSPHASFNALDDARAEYSYNIQVATFELCRHLPAARDLAEKSVAELSGSWQSPEKEPACDAELNSSNAEDAWKQRGADLTRYTARIDERYKADGEYRKAVLAIAIGASRYLDEVPQAIDILPEI